MNPRDEAVTHLKKTGLLSGLDDATLERIAASLRKACILLTVSLSGRGAQVTPSTLSHRAPSK